MKSSINGEVNMIMDIIEFQRRFGQHYEGPPRVLPNDMANFRFKRLIDEVQEYAEAYANLDAEGELDALVDIVYIAIGTALMRGWNFREAWARVHEANMTKLRKGLDIVKPEGFEHPSLGDLV